MDATENECEEQVTGFPTLVLYPAVKSERKFRQKLTYSGARELAPMVDFLLENSKNLDGIEDTSRGDEKKTQKYGRARIGEEEAQEEARVVSPGGVAEVAASVCGSVGVAGTALATTCAVALP